MSTETVERRPYRQHVRAERTAATRTRILAAAADLLMSRSYDEVTLALVAEHAGVTVPTVRAHVGSKEGLLLEGAADWARAEIGRRDVPPGDIAALARVLARRYEETGTVMRRYIALGERVPAVEAAIERSREEHRDWLERVFDEHLPRRPAALRSRCIAQLFVATEIYSWTTARTTVGLSARQAEVALVEHLQALVASWSSDREGAAR